MRIISFPSESEKSEAITRIIGSSEPNRDYYILIALSVSLATLGMLMQNTTVIIGSMLVAPLLYPFLAIALGFATFDTQLVTRSVDIILRSILMSVIVSIITAVAFSVTVDRREVTEFIVERLTPSYLHLAVGVIAGLAAALSLVKKNLANALPGAAIAVALIPPLAATGIGLAFINRSLFLNSAILFISNILGIMIATALFFLVMNFKTQDRSIDQNLKKEVLDLELEKSQSAE